MPIVSDTAPDTPTLEAIKSLTSEVKALRRDIERKSNRWKNRKEASRHIDVAPNTLSRLVRKGVLHKFNYDDEGIAKTVYDTEELDAWALSKKQM